MRKVWIDNWGPRMEYILRYSILTLLNYPDATLLDIQPLLTDDEFRSHVLTYVSERNIRRFWRSEFDKYNQRKRLLTTGASGSMIAITGPHPALQ